VSFVGQKEAFLLWWKKREAGEVKTQPLSWRRKNFLGDAELFSRFPIEIGLFKIPFCHMK